MFEFIFKLHCKGLIYKHLAKDIISVIKVFFKNFSGRRTKFDMSCDAVKHKQVRVFDDFN